ncbi:MAG TPA: MFS transporter [Gammaproteobacteria bacterium]|nr:MFS transporter [Gammaproteobacteria bacterium]
MIERDKLRPYFVWFLGAMFFLVDYVIRVSPSVLTPQLMETFHVNAFAIGLFSGYFYYAYISMQIPVGILVDRFGPKRLLVVSILICALSTLIFSNTDSISIGYFSRALMGFGAAFAFVGTLKLISLWFSAQRFALLAGITQAMGMLGAMIGQGPMSNLYHTIGWRETMHGFGLFFILLCLFVFIFVKDENGQLKQHDVVSTGKVKVFPALKAVLTNKQSWLNCLFVGLMYGPSACFGEQWGAPFLSVNQNISITSAGHETGIMFIGLAIGCPILGWISDYFKTRVMVMRISVGICFILLTTVIYGHLNPAWATAILFMYGFFNSGIVVSYAMASEINSRQFTGIALGLSNMSSVILGAIMIPIVGFILDLLWNGQILNGVHVFAPHEFKIAFLALPLGFIAAFIITFFQKDTRCQSVG